MLTLSNVHAAYGSRSVLNGVSIQVNAGEVVCILGRNGSGKSTLLRVCSGLLRVSSGSVLLGCQRVENWPAYRLARSGVSLLPQSGPVFPSLSARENLAVATAFRGSEPDPWGWMARLAPDLDPTWRDRRAGLLSGGEQRLLGLAMAISRRPRVLLLDEPSAGLAPAIALPVLQRAVGLAREIRAATIVVEQNVDFGTAVADRSLTMRQGVLESPGDFADATGGNIRQGDTTDAG